MHTLLSLKAKNLKLQNFNKKLRLCFSASIYTPCSTSSQNQPARLLKPSQLGFNTKMEASRYSNSSLFQLLGLIEDYDLPSSSALPRVITLLASVLGKMIQKNEKPLNARHNKFRFVNMDEEITMFHGSRAPSMNIHRYTERVHRYARCSPACFVAAFAYILRYLERPVATSMTRRLTSLNVHRLLITSLLVAAKFLDRRCYNNAYYAKIGGVSTEEMNRLERMFLFDLDFRLNITTEMFEKHCLMLQRETAPCGSRKLRTVLGEITCSCQAI